MSSFVHNNTDLTHSTDQRDFTFLPPAFIVCEPVLKPKFEGRDSEIRGTKGVVRGAGPDAIMRADANYRLCR